MTFGLGGDKLVPEDYDGDGKTDVAVWRQSTGVWYIWKSSTSSLLAYQWGLSSDKLAPADYDGDGKADPTVWRMESQPKFYSLHSTTQSMSVTVFGISTDCPVPSAQIQCISDSSGSPPDPTCPCCQHDLSDYE